MYDMVQWMRNPNLKVSHLEGDSYDYNTKVAGKVIQHCHDTGENLIFTKTTEYCGPWDIYTYDDEYIYDWITELGWPPIVPLDCYKAYTPKIPGILRSWDGNPWSIEHGKCPVYKYVGCKGFFLGDNEVSFSLTGPFMYDFGGNVGNLETIRVNYQWSPVDKEYRYLTTQHGWVRWEYWKYVNHVWIIQNHSNHNWVVPGIVQPNFPCFKIP